MARDDPEFSKLGRTEKQSFDLQRIVLQPVVAHVGHAKLKLIRSSEQIRSRRTKLTMFATG